jgi:hypothetical protein
MDASTWNVLHDGRIASASGALPGDLRLLIHIGYLCELLPTAGKQLVVELRGVELFQYRPFEGSAATFPHEVASLGLEILRAAAVGESIVVECADGSYGGQLHVRYSQAEVATLEGQPLSQTELEATSDRYWEAWDRHGKTPPPS